MILIGRAGGRSATSLLIAGELVRHQTFPPPPPPPSRRTRHYGEGQLVPLEEDTGRETSE